MRTAAPSRGIAAQVIDLKTDGCRRVTTLVSVPGLIGYILSVLLSR